MKTLGTLCTQAQNDNLPPPFDMMEALGVDIASAKKVLAISRTSDSELAMWAVLGWGIALGYYYAQQAKE